MAGLFSLLVLMCYLFFLVDWKELRGVLAQGGWAAVVIYCAVTVLIWYAMTTPQAVAQAPMHH